MGYTHTYPMGYLVADAQNIIVNEALTKDYEWVLLLEDDTIPPHDLFLQLNAYIRSAEFPVVSGLYFLKANPPEPLVYRGRGNGAFFDWKLGEKVWVDGVPTGCLLINCKVLKIMANESEDYKTVSGQVLKKIFETPARAWTDPETGVNHSAAGTSDLYWCDRVMKDNVLRRAGWPEIGKRKYQFLVDTNIFCKHIDLQSGAQYPIGWK